MQILNVSRPITWGYNAGYTYYVYSVYVSLTKIYVLSAIVYALTHFLSALIYRQRTLSVLGCSVYGNIRYVDLLHTCDLRLCIFKYISVHVKSTSASAHIYAQ